MWKVQHLLLLVLILISAEARHTRLKPDITSKIYSTQFRPLFQTMTDFMHLQEGMKVLSLDSGLSSFDSFSFAPLLGSSGEFVSLEEDPRAVLLRADAAREAGLEQFRAVEYKLKAGKPFPFEDNTFDAVYSGQAICESYDYVYALNELTRVLKVGGILLTSCPNFSSLQSNAIQGADEDRVRKALKEGAPHIGSFMFAKSAVDDFTRLKLENIDSYVFSYEDTDLFGEFREDIIKHINNYLLIKINPVIAEQRITKLRDLLEAGEFSFSINFSITTGRKPSDWVPSITITNKEDSPDSQTVSTPEVEESTGQPFESKLHEEVTAQMRSEDLREQQRKFAAATGGQERERRMKAEDVKVETQKRKSSTVEREEHLAEMREKRRAKGNDRRDWNKNRKGRRMAGADKGEDLSPEDLEREYRKDMREEL